MPPTESREENSFGLEKPECLQQKACSHFEFRGPGFRLTGVGGLFPASVTSSDKWGRPSISTQIAREATVSKRHLDPAVSRTTPVAAWAEGTYGPCQVGTESGDTGVQLQAWARTNRSSVEVRLDYERVSVTSTETWKWGQ